MMIVLRPPERLPKAEKIGRPIPQVRFWVAITMEKSVPGQPDSFATWIWNTPKLKRLAKDSIRIVQPAIRIGVKIKVLVIAADFGYPSRGCAWPVSWSIGELWRVGLPEPGPDPCNICCRGFRKDRHADNASLGMAKTG